MIGVMILLYLGIMTGCVMALGRYKVYGRMPIHFWRNSDQKKYWIKCLKIVIVLFPFIVVGDVFISPWVPFTVNTIPKSIAGNFLELTALFGGVFFSYALIIAWHRERSMI